MKWYYDINSLLYMYYGILLNIDFNRSGLWFKKSD